VNGSSTDVAPNWEGADHNYQPEHDYAILHLDSPLGPDSMDLFNGIDSTVESETMVQAGFPVSQAPDCINYNYVLAGDDSNLNGQYLAWSTAPAIDSDQAAGWVKTQLDVSDGQSGEPIFFCSGGCSADTDVEHDVAIMSGYYHPFGGTHWTGGASVKGHMTWITNHM
jgi:hypothetical protein